MEVLEWRWRKSSYSGSGGSNCVEVGAAWRKSSYSGNGGANCVEVGAAWSKSSYSGNGGGNCVEVARNLPAAVAVRDSKNPDGPVLMFSRDEWASFIGRVRASAV